MGQGVFFWGGGGCAFGCGILALHRRQAPSLCRVAPAPAIRVGGERKRERERERER